MESEPNFPRNVHLYCSLLIHLYVICLTGTSEQEVNASSVHCSVTAVQILNWGI